MEDKLNRMEMQLDIHTAQISKLFNRIEDTDLCIHQINTSLLQIKWGVFGAFACYVIHEIGILEAMRLTL